MRGDSQLSAAARSHLADPTHEKLVSPVSHWELAIKASVGKFTLSVPHEQFFETAFRSNCFIVLPIELRHTAVVATLPFHHKDPFDRMLIAQALADGLTIVSGDSTFDAYGVTRIW